MAIHSPLLVAWYVPPVVMAARVNMPGVITYPVQDITFDTVTTGAFSDCHADMFFTLGSAAGLDDYGRGRLRAAPTSTVLKVSRASQGYEDGQLNVVDNAYITVWLDYRVQAKIHTIVNYVEYKDTDIAVGDLTEEPPPICNMGSDCARRIDAGTGKLRLLFEGSNSMAVADGATIASYAWDIDGSSAFALGTTATDDDVFIDFDPGWHWVSLTVTDSNGKTMSGRRLVLAHDPDDSLAIETIKRLSFTRTQQGTTVQTELTRPLLRSDYPDGGHVLIWEDRDTLPGPESRDDQLFTGWHQLDQAGSRATETHLQKETRLTLVDVLGRMDSLPGWPQRVEVPTAEDLVETGINWGYMPTANMDKFLHYLLHWHSTAGGIADFYPSGTWDDYPFVLFDSGGATLYEQLQRQANRIVPDHNFTCDRFGIMRVVVDPMLQPVADRDPDTVGNITQQGISAIDFGYQRPPRVHTLRGSAILTQTEWIVGEDDEKELLTPVFAIAPGTAPGQGGREATIGERLAQSQSALNDCVGQHYARMNARYGNIRVTLNLNSTPWGFDPAAHRFVEVILAEEYLPQRGTDFFNIRALVTEVQIEYTATEQGLTRRATLTLERETIGLPAITEPVEPPLDPGEQPDPFTPPDFGLVDGQELVAGIDLDGNLYRTSDFQTPSGSGGPTWTQHSLGIAETIYSFVVDPFSPGYIEGAGSIDGWVATEDAIYKISDFFGTVTVDEVHSFATTADAASFHWRTIQASFGAFFSEGVNPWLLCVSYYGDTSGHEGTWATYSVDGGVTWAAEVEISEFYDDDTPTRFYPVGVYTSPKTPGLAYTAAYVQAVDDSLMPILGTWPDGGSLSILGPLARATIQASATESGGAPGTAEDGIRLVFAPPPEAERLEISVNWTFTTVRVGSGSGTADAFFDSPSPLTQTDDETITHPGDNATSSGSFTATWTKAGTADWPTNSGTIISSPPATPSAVANIRAFANANASGTYTTTLTLDVTVTEIELEDGTIYNPAAGTGRGFKSTNWGETWQEELLIVEPGAGLAGSIHLPWPTNDSEDISYFGNFANATNREFRLKKSQAGVISDISPNDGSRDYGVNRYGFAARTYDSNRQYVVVAVMGNDTSADPANDMHAVYISDDFGATWTEVVAPMADSGAPTNRAAFEAAFAGDTEQVLYLWGPPEYMSYSDDFGATVDDRSGNLDAFTPDGFIGIAGGPTGA